jgi:Cdc6-like AAA superfamily ATPase
MPPDAPQHRSGRVVDHRQSELGELAAFVRGNQSVALVGPSQAGKTALLDRLSRPATWPGVGLDQDNLFIYVSCPTLQELSHEAIFGQFATRMAAALEQRGLKREPALETAMVAPTRMAWEAAVRSINRRGVRVVLILDDFEALSSNPLLGIGFFNVLRSMTARFQLVLLTASTQPLFDLTFSGCSEEIRSSPFFNIFATVFLVPLPE